MRIGKFNSFHTEKVNKYVNFVNLEKYSSESASHPSKYTC